MTRGASVLVAALSAMLAGCSSTSTCNRDADATIIPKEKAIVDAVHLIYMSAPYHDPAKPLEGTPYAFFPAGRTITFQHDLGVMLLPGVPWLAFSDHGSLAPSAGNETILEKNDENSFAIKNDTCSEFYIWVRADRMPESSAAGAANSSDESAGAGGAQP